MSLLAEVAKAQGRGVLVVTHDGRTLPFASRVVCIDDGLIVGEGPRVDGESGGGARSLDPQWVRDIIADCRSRGVVPFPKQWGTHSNNPLVVEQGMSIAEAKALDKFGKGRGLVDGKPVREHPCGCNSARTRCS
jgi:energy-coupling factor transporter ATP-binding protein EcfA2